jgi:ABC-type branched-subunit amino acid transport system ATPase component
VAGGTGALFASFQDSVFPNNFDFPQLVIVYCMVILGGLGNIVGVILGAATLSILPEFLREYGAYRMMLYGLILIVIMAVRPQGIMGSIEMLTRQKKRPDKDETGLLRSSTDLYYTGEGGETPAADHHFRKTEQTLLELQDISQTFGGIKAVDRLSFTLHEGEILSIIGPNGAGKSTVFNLISGIYPPRSGRIRLDGRDITGLKPHQVAKAGIARTFQNLRLFNQMTVLDNAKVGQFCRTLAGPLSILFHLPRHKKEEARTEQKAAEILGLFGGRLTGYRHGQQAQFLSYANRRRLEIARALATDARVLLLDEPSAGMNPQETMEITRFIRTLRDRFGYAIILIEHKLNVVKTISDRVIALDYGVKIAEGSYEQVARNESVVEAYLGKKKD